jgi:hypothetical protein
MIPAPNPNNKYNIGTIQQIIPRNRGAIQQNIPRPNPQSNGGKRKATRKARKATRKARKEKRKTRK